MFGELGYYAQDSILGSYDSRLSKYYKDILYKYLPDTDERIMVMKETVYRDKKDYDNARKVNNLHLHMSGYNSSEFALVAFDPALLEREEKNIT